MPTAAKTTPKPRPGSVESIRHQVDDLKSATAMLKVVQAVEKAAAEPKEARAVGEKPNLDVEGAIYDVKAWASIAWLVWNETQWLLAATPDEHSLAIARIDRVIEKVNEAAEGLYNQYTGAGR
jgi:hypothetical protein